MLLVTNQKNMKTSNAIRLVFLPFGLLFKLYSLAKEGARDIHNQFRFIGAKIGAGCCINEISEIEPKTNISSNCLINNSQILPYTYIGDNCIIQNTTIGKYCSIANDVLIGLGKHPKNLISTSTLFYRIENAIGLQLIENDSDFEEYVNINIGNDVWIGARAIILDGIKVGSGAIIAANSVVTKNVPPYSIVAGVPAKIINYRFQEDKIEELLKLEWWNWTFEELKLKVNELNKD